MGRPKEVSDEAILEAARRLFLSHGAGVTAVEIGRDLGVSHTTLFNRFGSKEALMIASLGPPKDIPWVPATKSGPDDRSIQEQLVSHAKLIATYFQDLHAGLAVLHAAGISNERIYQGRGDGSRPAKGYQALADWLAQAQKQKRIAHCDASTLAITIISALNGWVFTAEVCGKPVSPKERDLHTQRFIRVLWEGICPEASRPQPGQTKRRKSTGLA